MEVRSLFQILTGQGKLPAGVRIAPRSHHILQLVVLGLVAGKIDNRQAAQHCDYTETNSTVDKRLPFWLRRVVYNLRGGFLLCPLIIALTLGCAGAFMSWLEETIPSISDFVPRALFPSHADPHAAQITLGGIAAATMKVVSSETEATVDERMPRPSQSGRQDRTIETAANTKKHGA